MTLPNPSPIVLNRNSNLYWILKINASCSAP